MDIEKLLYTVPEAAMRLGLGRSLVYELVMRGEIISIKIGRARRVPVSALDQFVARLAEEEESRLSPTGTHS